MSYLDWKVGDRVVFVGSGGNVFLHHSKGWRAYIPGFRKTKLSHHLAGGEVYRIEAITTHTDIYRNEPIVCIYLKGFRFREDGRVGFPAKWFRKVQPRKTDISIFTAMLTPSKVDA